MWKGLRDAYRYRKRKNMTCGDTEGDASYQREWEFKDILAYIDLKLPEKRKYFFKKTMFR